MASCYTGPMERLVTLPEGIVAGVGPGGVVRFADIPYAAPPVGAHRFAPPQPVCCF